MNDKPDHKLGQLKAKAVQCQITSADEFQEQFNVSRETMHQLLIYERELVRWQKAVNLVARSTLSDLWQRHFADSAQIVALAPDAQTWLDLGSGGGFPGMVVALLRAGQGQGGVTLLESDRRKCAFLQEVKRQTGIAVDIIDERIETVATQSRVDQVDVVSARALAPLPLLFTMAAPFLASTSTCIFLKGRTVATEITEASKLWQFDINLLQSLTDPESQVAVIRQLEAKREG